MGRALCLLSILICAVSCFYAHGEAEKVWGIPLKPDPPFAVDGDLSDWAAVPNAMSLNQAEQVVWGRNSWQSPQDLSGIVRMAWREDHLFLAADVTDDMLFQTQRGYGIWQGDHVELFLDMQPDLEPDRDAFGEGQFQFGLSPGNFSTTGDPLVDCAPEAFCYRPEGATAKRVAVAAKRTATGWTLEAAIPWQSLGIERPAAGMSMRFEVALSDTDTSEPQQECLMTTSTDTWAHQRSRLRLSALADTGGVPPLVTRQVPLFDSLALANGKTGSFTFEVPPTPPGRQAVLALDARLDYEKVAGFTPALRLTLNGQSIAAARLTNKPQRAKARGGDVYSMAAGDLFSTYYAPDFTSADADPHYGLLGGVKACSFEFAVADLVKEGANTLVVANAADGSITCPLISAHARLEFPLPLPPPKTKAGPPTGPLNRIDPLPDPQTDYIVEELPDARFDLAIGGETFRIESQFSTSAPAWVHGACAYFKHTRNIDRQPEALVVHDTFTNLSAENLPLMCRHYVMLEAPLKSLWLAGLEQGAEVGSTALPENPTTYAATGKHGVGFLPLDDVFRVHIANYAVSGAAGIADNNLVLRPNATYTAEWAVVPTGEPDYWRFINAARRLVDANFTIPGGFAFLRADAQTEQWTDTQIADFIRLKDAYYVCESMTYPLYKDRYTHGTSFQQVSHDSYRAGIQRWRRLAPESKSLVYFHCFIDVADEAPERFADSRTLRPDGLQADYGYPYDRLFFPTSGNSYGREIGRNVDIILDDIKADGVYWDEHEYSRWPYHYGEPWDGWSGDIDPVHMTIARLKSSITLLSESWRVELAKRILSRGPLVGNGAPYTRAMAALKFPCFIETGSITNCVRGYLHSPIALGDHLTERSEADAYRGMLAALNYGCVYHWYNDLTVVPEYHTLTRYMYPITPVELHEGYIIGRERILTNRSGLFGWGDDSRHEVHVFDDSGVEAIGYNAPELVLDGRTYSEIRIGEGWSAAVVRRELHADANSR
jgi:hypothetical protein